MTLAQEGGSTPGELSLTVFERLTGSEGFTLLARDASGLLNATMIIPDHGGSVAGSLRLDTGPASGHRPHEIEPVIAWLSRLAPDQELVLRAGPLQLARFHRGAAWPADLAALHRLVRALEVLQQHLRTILPVPEQFPTGEELREVLDVAQALSGTPARLRFDGVEATIRPGRLRAFLNAVPAERGALYSSNTPEVRLDGSVVPVPGVALWAPNVELVNRAELEAVSVDVQPHVARFRADPQAGVFLTRAVEEPGDPWTAVEMDAARLT